MGTTIERPLVLHTFPVTGGSHQDGTVVQPVTLSTQALHTSHRFPHYCLMSLCSYRVPARAPCDLELFCLLGLLLALIVSQTLKITIFSMTLTVLRIESYFIEHLSWNLAAVFFARNQTVILSVGQKAPESRVAFSLPYIWGVWCQGARHCGLDLDCLAELCLSVVSSARSSSLLARSPLGWADAARPTLTGWASWCTCPLRPAAAEGTWPLFSEVSVGSATVLPLRSLNLCLSFLDHKFVSQLQFLRTSFWFH